MFRAERQETWTDEDSIKFEHHVARVSRKVIQSAALAFGLFILNVALVIPLLAGHSLHKHWEPYGRWLIRSAMLLWLYLIIRVGFVWSSWKSARETRRDFGDTL